MVSDERLAELNAGRYPLGVTGSMGCGKSYVCSKLMALRGGLTASHVGVDELRRDILGTNQGYTTLRHNLSGEFGLGTNLDGPIDRRALCEIIYNDASAMQRFRDIIYPAIQYELGHCISEAHGLILVEWAMLAEDDMLATADYNVLLVTCDPGVQLERLLGGDLPDAQVRKRISSQWTNQEKRDMIVAQQHASAKGSLYLFDTTNNPGDAEYIALLEKIMVSI